MKKIAESEWKVMEVAWDSPPVSAQHVIDALGEREGWKPQTIKTLIARLVKKGALEFKQDRNRYLYSPTVLRDDMVSAETESFLDRVCQGSLVPVLCKLVETKRELDEEEIAALRELLRKEEKEGGGKTSRR